MSKKLNLYFVLGGAVSAGAYTAGVLDYFMSCLKEYMAIEESKREYDIQVKAIAGTSAGGMCGSIFLHSLTKGYPDSPENSDLFRTWVEDIDISVLSDMSDIKESTYPNALLNGKALRKIADDVLDSIPSDDDIESCSFLANECKLILSVTDTVGKSYAIDFVNDSKEKSYFITNHRDYFHFALSQPEDNDIELNSNREAWNRLKQVSIATGAFPVGLPPAWLERPSSVYDNHEYDLGKPINIGGNIHKYYGIDGGIGDNEPFGQLTRIIDKDDKDNAVILFIDPFPSENKKREGDSIPVQLQRLYSVFRNQSAYKPKEIAEFKKGKYTCYSILPKRSNNPKIEIHLAGALVGAFSGFIHQKFRHFDYQLGQRNCQKFLLDHFPYFKGLDARDEALALDWPSIRKEEYKKKTKALDKRLAHIARTFANGFWGFVLKVIIRRFKKPSNLILQELEKHQLVVK